MTLGPTMPWLIRDGDVLAWADVARSRAARRRGLLGRDGVDGALVLEPCRQVHTIGMRFPIDVAWCDRDGWVVRIATIRPGRISRPVCRARFVVEAGAGALDRWRVGIGDVLDLVDDPEGG